MRAGIAALAASFLAGLAQAAPAPIDFTARGLAVQANQRDADPAVYNYADAFLARYRAACGQVRTGEGRCRIAIVGDSTGAGWGAGTGTISANARARSFPTYLAAELSARGMPAQVENVFGTAAVNTSPDVAAQTPAGYTAAYAAYDPRVAFGGGSGSWTVYASNVPGGGWWQAVAGTTQSIAFTPTIPVDRFEVMAPTYPGNGSFDLKIDGGAATMLATNAAAGMTRLTVAAASAGIHTLTITPQVANTGTAYVGWIDAWNGAAPAVSIANMGFPGSTTGQWTDSGAVYRSPYAVPYYGAALAIVDLGINDWKDAGTGVAGFQANYQALIAYLKNGGADVILVAPFPSSTSRAPVAQQAAYIQVLYTLAKANNCVLIDMTKRFGSYAAQTSLTPGQYADALHPKATVYAGAARLIANVLLR